MNQSLRDNKYAPIGVFDSGVGGLTVAREIMRQLPQERIVYFGDTARVPYGSKSRETILRYSRQIIHFLESKGVKAIVVACNTASAYALEELRPEMKIPIIGVVKPGAKVAAATTRNGKIGVIGTEGTIASQIYTEMIRRHNPHAVVVGKACPLFVPLVEEGWLKDPITIEVARRYLASFQETGIDTLILGCTHYPLLRSVVRDIMGSGVELVNPAYETALGLGRLLEECGLTNDQAGIQEEYRLANDRTRIQEECVLANDRAGIQEKRSLANDRSGIQEERPLANDSAGSQDALMYQFYVSDAAEKFKNFANSILPCEIKEAQLIQIEE